LKNKYFNRFEIYHFLTKEHRDIPLFNGRFTEDKLKTITSKIFDPKEIDDCFICGPESMIFLIRDSLVEGGMPKENVHFELFTTGNSAAQQQQANKILEKKVEGTEVTIIDGGKEFHFTMSDEFDNILDGALSAGADLPFACKGGVCSTCRCKVIEGEAEMKINYALDESELARNFILSCQAVPMSKKLVVDFDV
jgi:ring-1,2-phenylacetyl-CoA epoxidase subunit PaaE